jgi:hypothetical protein
VYRVGALAQSQSAAEECNYPRRRTYLIDF